jgi:hypothetical protein
MAKRSGPYKLTDTAKEAAIRAMEKTGNAAAAAMAAGISLSTYYGKVGTTEERSDPEFREAIHLAKERYILSLEEEAYRRAVEGWDEDKLGAGGVMYSVRKFSDPLLIHLLKKKAPKVHGDKVEVEQTTTVRGDIGLRDLSPESRDLLRKIIERESEG